VTPQPACLVDAGSVEQAVKPCVEALGAAQGGQVSPGPDERLLDGVLRLVGIAEDEPGGGVQPEDRGSCERREGVMIAPPRSIHEILLHVAPWRRRGSCGSAQGVWRVDPVVPFRNRRSPFADRRSATIRPPVKIQEADAKRLLLAQGLPVPEWEVARTPAEARAAAERFLTRAEQVVIKAQVLVGGRGKAGGVKLAGSADEAEEVASSILGMSIKGSVVRKVLVGPAADIVRELYLSAVLDRAGR
jgi:hypothetical protein